MAENAFLDGLAAYLAAAGLTPAPASVGIAEPESDVVMPAIVLSLESTERVSVGLGERSALITNQALPWQASIDLANPVLPEDGTTPLLDGTRKVLTLPHGGLVKADGTEGPLTGADVTVKVKGVAQTVVAANPGANQVVADGTVGQLTFGAALPPDGKVDVTYFLGQWEQRIERIAGVLRADVCASAIDDARTLAAGVVAALLDPGALVGVRRLVEISATSLSSISAKEPGTTVRRRTARFSFVFENVIDQPESSGGIIRQIPIQASF
jgi:hypothetical protein